MDLAVAWHGLRLRLSARLGKRLGLGLAASWHSSEGRSRGNRRPSGRRRDHTNCCIAVRGFCRARNGRGSRPLRGSHVGFGRGLGRGGRRIDPDGWAPTQGSSDSAGGKRGRGRVRGRVRSGISGRRGRHLRRGGGGILCPCFGRHDQVVLGSRCRGLFKLTCADLEINRAQKLARCAGKRKGSWSLIQQGRRCARGQRLCSSSSRSRPRLVPRCSFLFHDQSNRIRVSFISR